MTGYGQGASEASGARFSCVIQSVNRKFLDCAITLPQELAFFETEIRKEIAKRVSRGSLKVYVEARFAEGGAVPNLELAKQIKRAYDEIAKELGYSEVPFSLIASNESLLKTERSNPKDEKVKEPLFEALSKALDQLDGAKKEEGDALKRHLLSCIGALKPSFDSIREKAPQAALRYREKLQKRIGEIFPRIEEHGEAILREVALFAEKADIEEETTRFAAHLLRLENLLNEGCSPLGKTLEFTIQELFREVNTIASKSGDISVKEEAIRIKSELEKMREQVQNVE